MKNIEMKSTLKQLLDDAVENYTTQDAFRYKVKKNGQEEVVGVTYQQLQKKCYSFARHLIKIGEKGNKIAIIGPTSVNWVVAFFGATISGSVAIPLDASLPAADVAELIDRGDASVLVFAKSKRDVANAVKENPKVKHYICIEEDMDEIIAQADSDSTPLSEPAENDIATIMFTSGTTGKSKGVMLSHRNLANNATAMDAGFNPGTIMMTVLPIHHAYCLSSDILKGLSSGGIVCINDSIMRVAQNIQLFNPHIILMVPLMIQTFARKLEDIPWYVPKRLLHNKIFGQNLHTIYSGGAYLAPAHRQMFKKFGIEILQGYGMTECSPVIATTPKGKHRDNSVGVVMPNVDIRIEDGEIWVKGSSVMRGYYNMPQETSDALTVDGWLKTGDLGYEDKGYLYLTGRKKFLIITANGENVSPEEIENKLSTSHLIMEILVRESEGVIEAEIFPDVEYITNNKIEDTEKALQKLIDDYNKTVPAYKRVAKLKLRDKEFEKNTTKKIKRY